MRPFHDFALLAGLALGAGATLAIHHVVATAYAPASDLLTTRHSPPAASLVPSRLAPAEADVALNAWLALPTVPDQAPVADLDARLARLRTLLSILPDTHFDRLFASLSTRPGAAESRLRRAAFEIWTEHDAPAAARWALALAPDETIDADDRLSHLSDAALAWARDDFDSAYAWVASTPDPTLLRELAPRLLGQLAAGAPLRAASLAAGAGDDALCSAARLAVFQAWSDQDPAAAFQNLGPAIARRREQHATLAGALAKWAGQAPSAALDCALAQPVPEGHDKGFWIDAAGSLLLDAPDALALFMSELARRSDVPGRDRLLGDFIGRWARKDSPAALAWIDALPELAQRGDLVESVFLSLTARDPEDILAFASRHPPTDQRDGLIIHLFGQWARNNPAKAETWLAANTDPALTSAAHQVEEVLIGVLAKSDPSAALARWHALPSDSRRDSAAYDLADSWARTDPAAAVRWLAVQLPDTCGPNTRFLGGCFGAPGAPVANWRWAHQDPLAFAVWLESFKPEPQTMIAYSAFGSSLPLYEQPDLPDPPPRAAYADQLARIPNSDIRESALHGHLRGWLRSDFQAARAWIESNDALSVETAANMIVKATPTR